MTNLKPDVQGLSTAANIDLGRHFADKIRAAFGQTVLLGETRADCFQIAAYGLGSLIGMTAGTYSAWQGEELQDPLDVARVVIEMLAEAKTAKQGGGAAP